MAKIPAGGGTCEVEEDEDIDCCVVIVAPAGCDEYAPFLEAKKAWNCLISKSNGCLRRIAHCCEAKVAALRCSGGMVESASNIQ